MKKKPRISSIDVEKTLRDFPAFVKAREKKMRKKIREEKKYLNEAVREVFKKDSK
ncbi:MAG TPA: hypothetical protein VFU15_00775 [Bacteroidia bacterium]|nr:hypothetical protein [Bacteroidia bacterium]